MLQHVAKHRASNALQLDVSAGYFEAPAAAISSVAFDRHGASRISGSLEANTSMPDVIICFCAIDGLHAMQVRTAWLLSIAAPASPSMHFKVLLLWIGLEQSQA